MKHVKKFDEFLQDTNPAADIKKKPETGAAETTATADAPATDAVPTAEKPAEEPETKGAEASNTTSPDKEKMEDPKAKASETPASDAADDTAKKEEEETDIKVDEATVIMDTTDPKSSTLKRLLKKHKVTMEVVNNSGPGGGNPEVELTGDRKDLEKVLASNDGWGDADLKDYIEEGNAFTVAMLKAKEEGLKEFEFNGKKYPLKEAKDIATFDEFISENFTLYNPSYNNMIGSDVLRTIPITHDVNMSVYGKAYVVDQNGSTKTTEVVVAEANLDNVIS